MGWKKKDMPTYSYTMGLPLLLYYLILLYAWFRLAWSATYAFVFLETGTKLLKFHFLEQYYHSSNCCCINSVLFTRKNSSTFATTLIMAGRNGRGLSSRRRVLAFALQG